MNRTEVKIFDTHLHYNMNPLWEDWRAFWKEAQRAGVKKSLVAGANFLSSQRAIDLASQEENFVAAVGLHPTCFLEEDFLTAVENPEVTASSLNQESTQMFLDYMYEQIMMLHDRQSRTSQVVAVGEIGLDYFRLRDRTDFPLIRKLQEELLRLQIDWALKSQLTVIFHLRDENNSFQVYEDIMPIIKKISPQVPVILHCVSGPPEFIETAVAQDAYVSFAGNVTYKNAQSLRDLISLVPADKLLIETDAPFLPPQAHRGQLCRPAYIAETVVFMQNTYQVDLDQVYENSQRVFGLDK